MARPVMRDRDGYWSLIQVAQEAGVTHRTARTMVSAGYLNPRVLKRHDIVVLKTVAQLHEALVPEGMTRTDAAPILLGRNLEAARIVRDFTARSFPERTAMLAVTPHRCELIEDPMRLMGAVGTMGSAPLLILPVGAWTQAVMGTGVTS